MINNIVLYFFERKDSEYNTSQCKNTTYTQSNLLEVCFLNWGKLNHYKKYETITYQVKRTLHISNSFGKASCSFGNDFLIILCRGWCTSCRWPPVNLDKLCVRFVTSIGHLPLTFSIYASIQCSKTLQLT